MGASKNIKYSGIYQNIFILTNVNYFMKHEYLDKRLKKLCQYAFFITILTLMLTLTYITTKPITGNSYAFKFMFVIIAIISFALFARMSVDIIFFIFSKPKRNKKTVAKNISKKSVRFSRKK